uniref:Uncharacterized protein n=1 Tax=Anguilla anguilla TaxID=7936 RepID=A0A0E9XG16_ANGAN
MINLANITKNNGISSLTRHVSFKSILNWNTCTFMSQIHGSRVYYSM